MLESRVRGCSEAIWGRITDLWEHEGIFRLFRSISNIPVMVTRLTHRPCLSCVPYTSLPILYQLNLISKYTPFASSMGDGDRWLTICDKVAGPSNLPRLKTPSASLSVTYFNMLRHNICLQILCEHSKYYAYCFWASPFDSGHAMCQRTLKLTQSFSLRSSIQIHSGSLQLIS